MRVKSFKIKHLWLAVLVVPGLVALITVLNLDSSTAFVHNIHTQKLPTETHRVDTNVDVDDKSKKSSLHRTGTAQKVDETEKSSHGGDSDTEEFFSQSAHLYDMGDIDCQGLFSLDETAVQKAVVRREQWQWRGQYSALSYLQYNNSCTQFVKQRGYITSTLSAEEENFPIAYRYVDFLQSESIELTLRKIAI